MTLRQQQHWYLTENYQCHIACMFHCEPEVLVESSINNLVCHEESCYSYIKYQVGLQTGTRLLSAILLNIKKRLSFSFRIGCNKAYIYRCIFIAI